MKGVFSIFFSLFFLGITYGQEKPVKFTVEVSTDSILMDNYFQVRFTVENADGHNFEAPDFSENFTVVSGPNYSSSVSTMNGRSTQSMAITYYLQPLDIGAYYIQPASVQANGEIMETNPIEVFVHPNPDGIKQSPPMNNGMFHMEFGNPFGNESPFDMEEFFRGFDGNMFPFDMNELFKGLDGQSMPLDSMGMDGLFKNFDMETMPLDLQELFKQFEMEMPELDQITPEDSTQPKKKKRKTTRI
ncbi:MAG: BatD family protein [Bacteroidota bacterium]